MSIFTIFIAFQIYRILLNFLGIASYQHKSDDNFCEIDQYRHDPYRVSALAHLHTLPNLIR